MGKLLEEVTLKQINLDEKFQVFKAACELYQQEVVNEDDTDECVEYCHESE